MKVVRDILGGRREQLTDEIENQSIRLHHPIRETITTGIVEILDIKIDGGEYHSVDNRKREFKHQVQLESSWLWGLASEIHGK